MENNYSAHRREVFGRFPEKYQAALACALQQPVVTVAVLAVYALMGIDYERLFATQFGADMFGGLISQFFAIMFVPLFMLTVTKKDAVSTLRMKKRPDVVQIISLTVMSMGVFLFAQALNGVFITALSGIFGEPSDASDIANCENPVQLIFGIVIMCCLPAFGEEMFFRGYVMRAYERISPAAAVIISSLAFSVMHGNAQQMFYAFTVGIILGVVTFSSDSLFAGSIVHFLLNLFSTVIMYPPVYSKYLYFAENYSVIYSGIVMYICPAIFVGGLVWFLIYTKKKNLKLYGKKFVSDGEYIKFAPKQGTGKNIAECLCWVFFALINLYSAASLWKGI